MWTMIKKYSSTEQMRAQITELNTGTWIGTHGVPISWQPLIEALDTFIKNYAKWDEATCKNHWYQQVGGAQLMLSAHVINEYSHTYRPLQPCPNWNGSAEQALPRTGVTDWRTAGTISGELGRSFAWFAQIYGSVRGPLSAEQVRIAILSVSGATNVRNRCVADHAACVELLKSRTEQAQALVSELTTMPAAKPRLAAMS